MRLGLIRARAGRLAARRGATVTEYALVLALVVIVVIGSLSSLGAALQAKLAEIIREVSGAR